MFFFGFRICIQNEGPERVKSSRSVLVRLLGVASNDFSKFIKVVFEKKFDEIFNICKFHGFLDLFSGLSSP